MAQSVRKTIRQLLVKIMTPTKQPVDPVKEAIKAAPEDILKQKV